MKSKNVFAGFFIVFLVISVITNVVLFHHVKELNSDVEFLKKVATSKSENTGDLVSQCEDWVYTVKIGNDPAGSFSEEFIPSLYAAWGAADPYNKDRIKKIVSEAEEVIANSNSRKVVLIRQQPWYPGMMAGLKKDFLGKS